jgi:hypothetical protein
MERRIIFLVLETILEKITDPMVPILAQEF